MTISSVRMQSCAGWRSWERPSNTFPPRFERLTRTYRGVVSPGLDKAIHDYIGVDVELVRTVATSMLAQIKVDVKAVLEGCLLSRTGLYNPELNLTRKSTRS
jgi:hypothetical protein